MGKAQIVSGGEDGQYTIEVLHNRERIDAEIAWLDERIDALTQELSGLQDARAGLVAERNAIVADIDAAIASTPEGEIPNVEALLIQLSAASSKVQAIDARIAVTTGRKLSITKRREALQAVPANPQQSAWCADFTEDLTGTVGTVDLPGEGTVGEFATWRRIIIRPGYSGAASYSAGRDGQTFHRIGMSPAQAFYNAAILPGWQRWKPLHRIGTLTAVDKELDTCSLTLQAEDSSAQSLIIDPPDLQYNLTDVPIVYMDCASDPFEVADRVLVQFDGQDWSNPKVIGFESNPKECASDIIVGYVINFNVDLLSIQQVNLVRPPPPEGWFRNRGVSTMNLLLYGLPQNDLPYGGQEVFIWTTSHELVEAAEVFSELPTADSVQTLIHPEGGLGLINLMSVFVPQPDDQPGRSANGTHLDAGGINPKRFNKPNDTYALTSTSVVVTNKQYWSVASSWYYDANISPYQNRRFWSNDIDLTNVWAEETVEITLDMALEFIVYEDMVYEREKILSYVQPDYIPERSLSDGAFTNEIIAIGYKERPDLDPASV